MDALPAGTVPRSEVAQWAVGRYPSHVSAAVVNATGESWSYRGTAATTVHPARGGCVRVDRGGDGPFHLVEEFCPMAGSVALSAMALQVERATSGLTFVCDGVDVLGVGDRVGRCSAADTTASVATSVSARTEPVAVGRRFVAAVHVHQSVRLQGAFDGTIEIDRWFAERGGPEVRTYASMTWRRTPHDGASFGLLQSVWSSMQADVPRRAEDRRANCPDCPPPIRAADR